MTLSTTLSDKSLIYVEDEVIVAIEVGEALQDLGFRSVHIAHNLRGARRVLEQHSVDFAILDVNLGNGERTLDLGRELAEKGVTVIFASGYNKSELAPEVQQYPFLEKPVSIREITEKVQSLIEA